MNSTTPDPFLGVIFTAVSWFLFGVPFYAILWQLYTKAGHAGWKAVIPVYGSYVMGLIGKVPKLGVISGIGLVLYYVVGYTPLRSNTVVALVVILWAALSLIVLRKFIMRYDAGIGKWLVFLFLPFIGIFFVKSVRFKDDTMSAVTPSAVPQVPQGAGSQNNLSPESQQPPVQPPQP